MGVFSLFPSLNKRQTNTHTHTPTEYTIHGIEAKKDKPTKIMWYFCHRIIKRRNQYSKSWKKADKATQHNLISVLSLDKWENSFSALAFESNTFKVNKRLHMNWKSLYRSISFLVSWNWQQLINYVSSHRINFELSFQKIFTYAGKFFRFLPRFQPASLRLDIIWLTDDLSTFSPRLVWFVEWIQRILGFSSFIFFLSQSVSNLMIFLVQQSRFQTSKKNSFDCFLQSLRGEWSFRLGVRERRKEGEGEGRGGFRRMSGACRWKTVRIVAMTTSVCVCKGMRRAHFIPNFGFTPDPNRYGPFRIRLLIGSIDTLPLSQTSDRLSQNAV